MSLEGLGGGQDVCTAGAGELDAAVDYINVLLQLSLHLKYRYDQFLYRMTSQTWPCFSGTL